MSQSLQSLYESSHLGGTNAAYVDALFEDWLSDPALVPEVWQKTFAALSDGSDLSHADVLDKFAALKASGHYRLGGFSSTNTAGTNHKQAGVSKMINAFRVRGHQAAQLDPLDLNPRPDIPDLLLKAHDLDDGDLNTEFDTGSLAAPNRMLLKDILDLVEKVYCGTIGSEYMHITDTIQRRWVQERLEGSQGHFSQDSETRLRILEKLTAASGMEQYLHNKYVGQKRFSLEGGDSLIPLLNELVLHTGKAGTKEVVIGMAHRGRLNVLVNIMGKPTAQLFAEFDGTSHEPDHNDDDISDGAGDVKYHLGYSSDMVTDDHSVHLSLAFNPSHLEIVDPVVVGSARARQIKRDDRKLTEVLPVLIHGDAAVAGQGVVMELFNMSQARGFAVGGSLHVVVNNQVGFTTSNPIDARSTLYCTEVAKMVQAPIFHVNADDPDAVVFVTKMAEDFRREFRKDVVIDLICYRKHGHNEADEPAATQPLMYQVVRKHATPRELFAETLITEKVIDKAQAEQLVSGYRDKLDAGERVIEVLANEDQKGLSFDWSKYIDQHWRTEVQTSANAERLKTLSDQLTDLPEGFKLHSRVNKVVENRRLMANAEMPMDWGFAETMAYATLIEEGYGLRLVGQDSGRGTFFHRHAILHDQNTGKTHLGLQQLAQNPDRVTVIDSLLSEEAVMGFEYGYASTDPETLVIWEAQFGDFANGAQVVIDQFITSGETKWGRLSGLVLFLPHGQEGQGPEHSSARLERFLQMCAEDNIQVCVPSIPSQFFHMIRRQMLRPYRKPLIVMTPKSLLRHKASTSPLTQLTDGHFQLVIDEVNEVKADQIKRVVLCAGKVYFDLAAMRDEHQLESIAIVRVEQLYPFPTEELKQTLSQYKNAEQVIWCQEEPHNQGAWWMIRDRLVACLDQHQQLDYAGRGELASPAVGYAKVFAIEQKQLTSDALDIAVE